MKPRRARRNRVSFGMHAYNAIGTLIVSTAGAIALVACTRFMRGEI